MNVTLEPFAGRVTFRTSAPREFDYWRDVVAMLLDGVALQCVAAGAVLVGHIKGIALVDAGYLRGNCVSAAIPADVGGSLRAPVAELAFDVAVLVHGLEWEVIRGAVEVALRHLCADWACTARMQAKPAHNAAHLHDSWSGQ